MALVRDKTENGLKSEENVMHAIAECFQTWHTSDAYNFLPEQINPWSGMYDLQGLDNIAGWEP